jgi:hypothetical protein
VKNFKKMSEKEAREFFLVNGLNIDEKDVTIVLELLYTLAEIAVEQCNNSTVDEAM